MKKNVEVEIRGPLSKSENCSLSKILRSKGKFIGFKNRVLIDYTELKNGGVEKRKEDIRLRVTNGIPEIILKKGEWGGSDKRKEISIKGKPGEFDTFVELFGALGLVKGVLCIRKILVYKYRGIEFALVEVPGHSYYYEAEKMAKSNVNHLKITEQIKAICKELNLVIFEDKDFFKYIKRLNLEANEKFDFAKVSNDYFKKRFGV